MLTDDYSITSLPGHIRPHPLQEDAQPEARCGQELDVNESPNQPRHQPAHLDLPALQNGEAPAHYGHVALIEIAKWRRFLATGYPAVNEFSCITSLLHSHLRDAGKRLAVLLECCGIANNKDFGMSGHSQIFLNAHPPRAVCLNL